MSIKVDWAELEWAEVPVGERATVFRGPTPTIDEVDVVAVRLAPGKVWEVPADSPEQVVVVTRGELDVAVRDGSRRAGARSLAFLALGEPRRLANVGTDVAEFHVLGFRTPETGDPGYEPFASRVIRWEDVPVETDPGTPEEPDPWFRERRVFIPATTTASSPRLYVHSTSIDPGSRSTFHPTHRHPCLYVGMSGTLRFTEDNGSVYDLSSPGGFFCMQEEAGHDQVPIGDDITSYFVVQISTSRTPATAPAV